jgi:hypothetical protein
MFSLSFMVDLLRDSYLETHEFRPLSIPSEVKGAVAVQSLNYPACLNCSELFVILYDFKKVGTIGREADVFSCIASISRSRLIALLLCMEGIQAITSDVVNVSAGAQAGQLEGVASFALLTPRGKNTYFVRLLY